mmetsp:Transcript_73178/g.128969  ORF Transcript_73178/g.128969 Transcript_73178/m.128969 type:complete len:260 (+) Transcript_73178:64-843(+)
MVPTTRQTPSGRQPCRDCRTIGLPWPIQSRTRRVVSGCCSRMDMDTPSGWTVTPASPVRSSTVPPRASNRWRRHAISRPQETPMLRTFSTSTSGPPPNPQRMGLNSFAMHSSASSCVMAPSSTSSCISDRETFQSCSRPRRIPCSTTATRSPRFCSTQATKMPSVPPQTTTSYVGGTPKGSVASLTNSGAGPASAPVFISRSPFQTPSARFRASYVVAPPAPPASCWRSATSSIIRWVRVGASLTRAYMEMDEAEARGV